MILGPDCGEWWDAANLSTPTQTVQRERNRRLREFLVSQGHIQVLVPDEAEASEMYAAERADFTEAGQ